MAYISVNGYDFPPPKRGAKPTVSTMVDAGRNANGMVVGQRVGRDQYKLDTLEWPWLTDAYGAECVFRICHFSGSGHYEKNNNKDVPRR
mgnify:CR=1 FL=1